MKLIHGFTSMEVQKAYLSCIDGIRVGDKIFWNKNPWPLCRDYSSLPGKIVSVISGINSRYNIFFTLKKTIIIDCGINQGSFRINDFIPEIQKQILFYNPNYKVSENRFNMLGPQYLITKIIKK
jgi:hypothetical protein